MEREYDTQRFDSKGKSEPSKNNSEFQPKNESYGNHESSSSIQMNTKEVKKPNMADHAKKTNSITGMFTTTAVAVTVVAASTIFSGASDANIVKVKGFEDSIFYHVNVPYEDQYTEGSLILHVESQLDEYDIALDFGDSYGFLPSIATNTNYSMTLEVGSTLGTSKLGSVDTNTAQGYQSVIFYPKLLSDHDAELLDYTLRIYSEDVLNQLSSMTLKTTVFDPYTNTTTEFEDISLSTTDTSFTLSGIPNSNVKIDMEVIGVVAETGETVVIETDTFITPLKTITNGFVSSLSNKEAIYTVLPDFTYLVDPVYTVNLYDVDGMLEQVIIDEETDDPLVLFENLYPNTKYGIEGLVSFNHPVTGELLELLLSQDEFVTPDKLDIITSQTKLDSNVQFNITAEGNTSLYNKAYVKDDSNQVTFYDLTLLDANTIFIQIELPILATDQTYEIGFSNDEDLFIIDTITIEGATQ